jgi:hypothetical protein
MYLNSFWKCVYIIRWRLYILRYILCMVCLKCPNYLTLFIFYTLTNVYNYINRFYFRALITGRAMHSKYNLLHFLMPFTLLEIAKGECGNCWYNSRLEGIEAKSMRRNYWQLHRLFNGYRHWMESNLKTEIL